MTRVTKGLGACLCALLAAMALGACGSSSSSKSKSTSTTKAVTQPKGSAFTVGTICSCSGAQAASTALVGDAVKVWAASVNASGGINGHPVKLISFDDAGNPATALADVQQMVQSDHIQALVNDGSLADGNFESYITKAGVPVIGGYPVSVPFVTSPDFFAIGSTLPVDTVGLAGLAKASGVKKVALVYCAESPICAEAVPITKGAATLAGVGFTALSVSSSAPSYTAPCLALKSQGVDAISMALNGAVVPRVMDACAQQGYKPKLLANMASVLPTWVTDPNLQGALITSGTVPNTATSNPGVVAFLAAVKKYDPGILTSPQLDVAALWGWMSGKLFEAAAQAGSLTPTSTPAQVTQALYKAKGTTLGGLTAPLPITAGAPVFSPCFYSVTINAKALQSLGGGKPSCLTAPQMTALVAGLKKLLG